MLQAHIDPDLCPALDVLHLTHDLDGKLHVVSVCTAHDAYPLDRVAWIGDDALFFVANQTEPAYSTTIREGDMLAIRIELPARAFILYRAVVPLKLRIALFTGLVFQAVRIEAIDGTPGPIC